MTTMARRQKMITSSRVDFMENPHCTLHGLRSTAPLVFASHTAMTTMAMAAATMTTTTNRQVDFEWGMLACKGAKQWKKKRKNTN